MKIQIVGVPVFCFTLTQAEVDALIELAKMHYDHACMHAAEPGGVLQDWARELLQAKSINAHLEPGEEAFIPRMRATFDQLDLVAKITEPTNYIGKAKNYAGLGLKVHFAFVHAMNEANDHHKEWQTSVGE